MARRPLVRCRDCGRARPEHRGGRCARCYRLARTVEAVCALCGQLRRCGAGGVCQRCKRRGRATGGACAACRRQVCRLWSGRCASCAHSGWSVGSCQDCCAWALSIAGTPARCRACRDFAARNPVGQCRSCRRSLPVNRQQRCRLCTAARRDAKRAGGQEPAAEPAQAGIQLFFGDLESGRLAPSAAAPGQYLESVAAVQVDGQLELFSLPPEPGRADLAAEQWALTPAGRGTLSELAAFAAARGWRRPTLRTVARAVTLVAVIGPAATQPLDVSADMAAELRRRRLPVHRLREFLDSQTIGLGELPPAGGDARAPHRLPADLPAAMTRELSTWLEVLSGTLGRARPHAETTIAAYLRAVVAVMGDWAGRYTSLREVTTDDVTAQLQRLTGSQRTGTTVALRSLFAALKSQRAIFTDPARRVRPGRFPRRPVLGLDAGARADLLASTARADHRLVLLLAGVHALSRADITALRLEQVDLATRHLLVRGRRVPLDELTRQHLGDWLQERRTRWPGTANPHLLLTSKSAYGLAPVSTRYFRGLPTPTSQLRADRLLGAAADSGGDPLTLVRLFGVSDDTAVRYCTELLRPEHPETGT